MSNDTTPMKTCTKCGQAFPATTEYFYPQKAGKDELISWCKECSAEKARQYNKANREKIAERGRQYREANRERVAEQKHQYYIANLEQIAERHRQYYIANLEKFAESGRQWREDNPEYYAEYSRQYREANHETLAEKGRQYREDNREKEAERRRQYRLKNPAKLAEKGRQYRLKNPEETRNYVLRYRARKRNLPDTLTTEQWLQCLDYFNYCCPVCDSQLRDLFGDIEPHRDHWIPITHEGDDNPGTVATNIVCLCNTCNKSKQAKLPDVWLKQKFGTRKANEILARIEAYFATLDS